MAVGLAGMMTGWTLVNEHGLMVANHLGGGMESRMPAVPTLLLAREVAQHAATVEEGIAILRKLPRMRGQIIWLAQDADDAIKRPARAVAVEYDAKELVVRESEKGVLIITNHNRKLGGGIGEWGTWCYRYRALEKAIGARKGTLDGSVPLTAGENVANSLTQHIVQFAPRKKILRVWHNLGEEKERDFVDYPMP
jgi:hypothetical protein